ncbi:hypothetical protein [Halomarina rubra]|uniref:Uncharacterized protein n=1 Tax=Halomarina rubra TaxID=2071873 RepID=A0ABD6AT24_9EURY|nr:hypothetical protein [Halomarina rubra]
MTREFCVNQAPTGHIGGDPGVADVATDGGLVGNDDGTDSDGDGTNDDGLPDDAVRLTKEQVTESIQSALATYREGGVPALLDTASEAEGDERVVWETVAESAVNAETRKWAEAADENDRDDVTGEDVQLASYAAARRYAAAVEPGYVIGPTTFDLPDDTADGDDGDEARADGGRTPLADLFSSFPATSAGEREREQAATERVESAATAYENGEPSANEAEQKNPVGGRTLPGANFSASVASPSAKMNGGPSRLGGPVTSVREYERRENASLTANRDRGGDGPEDADGFPSLSADAYRNAYDDRGWRRGRDSLADDREENRERRGGR